LPTINKFKNAILKSEYIKKLAQELKIEEAALLEELKKVKDDRPYAELNPPGPSKALNINPTEKLLIKLMLEERELIERIKDTLEPADFQDERTARVVSIMFDLVSQGKNIEPSSLVSYLGDEGISQLICESVFLPDVSSQNKDKVVSDCIQRIKKERTKLKRENLHEQIKSAQHLGDEEKLHQLIREFHQLIKKE
jgi:replicative DNA helicase